MTAMAAQIAGLDEPVRRYLTHAIRDGAPLSGGVRITSEGRIKVRRWRRFTAQERCDGRSYTWDARLHAGPMTVLEVIDRYDAGIASTDGKLFGVLMLFHAGDENTTRSAAGRAALERVWCPWSLLPDSGVSWRTEADDRIVATFEVPPETADLTLSVDADGALESVLLPRWSTVGHDHWDYIPCGGTIHEERDFGGLVVPSQATFEWWYGTPQNTPYFRARVLDVRAD